MNNYILLIFSLSTLLFGQIIEIDNCTYSDLTEIPYLGGNLKPEVQPSWNNPDYVNFLDELEIQMMRWPGAEASNFFDWNKGTILPCYKWDKDPCFPADCPQLNDDSVNYCSENDIYSVCNTLSAREWHYNNDLVLTNVGEEICKKIANYTNNFSSHYLDVITNKLNKDLNPLFVINMLNPSYYDIEEAIFDDDCNITNQESLKNTIDIQLDSIALAVTNYNINPTDIYIQLSNEPFIPDHEWIRKAWPTADEYAQDAIMCAYKIREHPLLHDAKIGLGGDVQYDDGCDGCTEHPLRCDWNENLWTYITNQGETHLFDAITFHKYSGLFNMKIPNFDETNCDILEGWQNIDIYDSSQFGKFGVAPYSLRDNCIMNYFIKWNVANVQYTMNRWDGGACWNDSNLSGNVLYDELTGGNNDIEIWMTEYDFGLDGKPYLYDNDPNAGKPYQGTWSHTLHSLYETVSYMTKIPNIKILISNNINGFSGNYRLIDTYAYTDDEDGTNACKFHNEDGISSCFEKCSNEFIRLSPKGEAARLLNQLAWRNENIREINFNNQVNYTTIKRYNTEISWNINDIYGWKFDPEGDYLFINFSENQYEINLEDNNMYHYSIITTDSLFKKNYFHLNPSINYCADTSDSYPNCTIGYDGYYQWEFSSYSTVPNNLDEYFSHSSNITFINGDLESSSMLILPKHSIIQVKKLGNSNCGDGEVELWDTCYDIATTTSIDLSNSNLSGTIPSTIGQLTNLYSLRLQNNELSGEIPSELFDIQGLRYINLSGNSLSGEIPWNICDWIELWPFGWTNDLIIMNNNLCPPYPDCLLDMGNGEMFFDLNYQDTSLCEELSNIDIYPLVYSLSKPYPNPFNPTTTISFSIPSFEFVSIKVYNLKGELISTLIEKNLSPGIYNLIWNAKDCSSGQYFVKMESENYSKTEIVTLVK